MMEILNIPTGAYEESLEALQLELLKESYSLLIIYNPEMYINSSKVDKRFIVIVNRIGTNVDCLSLAAKIQGEESKLFILNEIAS